MDRTRRRCAVLFLQTEIPLSSAVNVIPAIAVLLTLAAVRDFATRSVPNWIAVAITLCGSSLHLLYGHPLVPMLSGILVLVAASIPWHFGLLGGADVKLLAAAAIAAPSGSLGSLLLAIALAGGVLALLYLVLSYLIPRPAPGPRTGLLRRILKAEAWRIHRRGPLPYAAAIAAGTIVTLFSS